MKLKNLLAMTAVALCISSCSNHNEPETPTSAERKTIENLNVTDYGKWTYINLQTGESKQYEDTSEWVYTDGSTRPAQPDPEIEIDWHIAIHRYEIKTHEGEVFDTRQTDMEQITSLPEGAYIHDERITHQDKEFPIMTDMSKMMEGSVGYAKTATINRSLCGWVTKKETGAMPPVIYTPNRHVFILKCNDGSWAKLQFTAAGNTETNKSGFVSFAYEFFPAK